MAKAPKAESTRKPPVPSESHADIADWMRRAMPDLHPVVTRLDALLRDTLPESLQYAVKLKSLDEVESSEIRTWIEQAQRVPGWK